MAKTRGWWELDINVEPDQVDLDHIADLIRQGYTSGEVAGEGDINLNGEEDSGENATT